MKAVCVSALMAFAAIGPAMAADCPSLRLAASVQLQPAADGSAEFVPVMIGGVRKLLVLDTGAEVSVLSPAVVKELNLETYTANGRAYDLTGHYTERGAITSLAIGQLKNDRIRFMVTGDDQPSPFGEGIAGVLGADILGNLDLSIDFGTHKLDLLDPRHCEGKVVYWPERPLAVVPFERIGTAQIIIPVTLDGHELKAYVDTGAWRSTIRQPRAERTFDLVMGSPDAPADGKLNGDENLTTWRHTFKSLTLEGITVSNLELDIIPDRLTQHLAMGAETGTRINTRDAALEPDILLGMNVLKHLHVYIAYKEKRIYITPAAVVAASSAKPAP
jgi:predicted aspartyl protease